MLLEGFFRPTFIMVSTPRYQNQDVNYPKSSEKPLCRQPLDSDSVHSLHTFTQQHLDYDPVHFLHVFVHQICIRVQPMKKQQQKYYNHNISLSIFVSPSLLHRNSFEAALF